LFITASMDNYTEENRTELCAVVNLKLKQPITEDWA